MYKTYLIDLDGTMYAGTRRIPGAKEFIDHLLREGIDFVLFTNNASRTPKQAKEHMEKLGFEGIQEEHFFTSAMAAAMYVRTLSDKNKVYVVGQEGLRQALREQGFKLIDESEQADYVFVGLDRSGTYNVYSAAVRQLVGGATLVGTNNDRFLLQEDGAYLGNGSVVAMLEYACSTQSIKIGKPHRTMVDMYLQWSHKNIEDCAIIGDNLETDIACGNGVGMDTILVETGVHQASAQEKLGIFATKVCKDLFDLI
ncbi:MAG: HAD-IIA family hydrolase [Erysipelotrichales bacterium]|nr:HAD-IIA family hydrolase [Erysipelotrichales bacterium]